MRCCSTFSRVLREVACNLNTLEFKKSILSPDRLTLGHFAPRPPGRFRGQTPVLTTLVDGHVLLRGLRKVPLIEVRVSSLLKAHVHHGRDDLAPLDERRGIQIPVASTADAVHLPRSGEL
jgi:hypothetical protein